VGLDTRPVAVCTASGARPLEAGSTAVISAKCSSTKGRCRTRRRITPMTGAQFEIRIDGTPRSYRDRKDFAMEAARLIKSKNPQSIVEVKDLQSRDITAVALRPG
jgi:hypothetical protein